MILHVFPILYPNKLRIGALTHLRKDDYSSYFLTPGNMVEYIVAHPLELQTTQFKCLPIALKLIRYPTSLHLVSELSFPYKLIIKIFFLPMLRHSQMRLSIFICVSVSPDVAYHLLYGLNDREWKCLISVFVFLSKLHSMKLHRLMI